MDETRSERQGGIASAYEPPELEVISLGCEISAYAPLDDEPIL